MTTLPTGPAQELDSLGIHFDAGHTPAVTCGDLRLSRSGADPSSRYKWPDGLVLRASHVSNGTPVASFQGEESCV